MLQSNTNIPTISFVVSNKNKRLLSVDGFIYQQNKSTSKVTYWICKERMCWAGIHLDSNDKFLKHTKATHTHLPTPERQEIRKMMANIKDRVKNESTAIGQIYNEELARTNLSRSALATIYASREASKFELSSPMKSVITFSSRLWPKSNSTSNYTYSSHISGLRHSIVLSTNNRRETISAGRSSSTC